MKITLDPQQVIAIAQAMLDHNIDKPITFNVPDGAQSATLRIVDHCCIFIGATFDDHSERIPIELTDEQKARITTNREKIIDFISRLMVVDAEHKRAEDSSSRKWEN